MTKVLKEVQISEELTLYIQKLNFEVEGYKSIICTIIKSRGDFIYNKDIYNYHMEKFREINIEYRVALEELIREYADELKSINGISATVNFLTNVVNITQPIGEVSCECNVEE